VVEADHNATRNPELVAAGSGGVLGTPEVAKAVEPLVVDVGCSKGESRGRLEREGRWRMERKGERSEVEEVERFGALELAR
jgi:hypothetical protein